MARVFLSYAREDSPRVRPLAAALEKEGHTVWWDEHVPSGDQFTRAIQDALDNADVVVVAWSKASVQSAWVRDEAAYGRDRERLIPVTVDGTLPPLGFREYQSIDLAAWNGRSGARHLHPLKKAIAAKVAVHRPTANEAPERSVRTRPRWVILAAVAIVLVPIGLVTSGLINNPLAMQEQVPLSVAVLPFADLSQARDKAFYAEGVAEEILSTLAAQQGIKVLGRTSARLIERNADPTELRSKLGVTHLLEGSLRSAGDQVRVNVRLIDTSDGRQVWEEEYQGGPADIFAVQDQIAGMVVQRLRGTLGQRQMRTATPTDPETYQTYLAARALMRTRAEAALREAFELAKTVVRRAPNYAPGHALIAELYHLLSDDYAAYGSMPLEHARKIGLPHAVQAIRLAPEEADGYAALGLLSSHTNALRPLRRAIQLDPSRGEIRTWLGFKLNELGRHDEALSEYRAAADIDPLGFVPANRYVQVLAAAGEHRQALRTLNQFLARGGNAAHRHPMMIQIATAQANPSVVVAHGRKMLATEQVRHQYFRLAIAAALHALGRSGEAAKILLPSQDLYALFYAGHRDELRRRIVRQGPKVWKSVDAPVAFLHSATMRDWSLLAQLYDKRGLSFHDFCEQRANDAVPFVLALRAIGRGDEAGELLNCLRVRTSVELSNKARLPQGWPGEVEFRRASIAALDADRAGALRWLDRTVSRGWLGQPYSSRLSDYPQFDGLRSDHRFAGLQRRIDAEIQYESSELLKIRSPSG